MADRVARDGPVGLVEIDQAYDVVASNDAARLVLGLRESTDGTNLLDLARFHPLAALRDAIDNAFRTGEPTRCHGFSDDDGEGTAEREVRITCLPPAGDAAPGPTVALVVDDITGLRRRPFPEPDRAPPSAPTAGAADRSGGTRGAAERPWEAVAAPSVPPEEARSRLRWLLKIETIGIVIFRVDGAVTDANDAFLRISGYDRGDLERGLVRWDTMTPPEWKARSLEAIDEFIASGQTTPHEKEYLRKDGSRWSALCAATRLEGGEGIEFVVDITEAKRAEADLSQREERYRALFDAIDQGFCVVEVLFDAAGRPVDYRFEETNPAFERQTGLHGAAGRWMRELAPDHEARWFELYGRVAETGEPARFTSEAKALGGRWFEVSAFRLGGGGSRRVAILFTDISERRRTEEGLRASEERFRTLIQRSADAVQLVTPDGTILYSSDSVEAVLGYRPDEIAGRGIAPYVHPDDLAAVVAWIGGVAQEPGSVSSNQYRVRHKDGTWAWVETTIANHLDTPSIGAIVGNFRNITTRKELERQKDEFVAVATHELRTPVTSLKGYAQLLRNRFRKAGDEASALLMERMDGQTDRLVALIGDLLDATKVEAGQLRLESEPFAIDDLVGERAAEMQLTTEDHRIRDVGHADAEVVADRDRVGQVLTNLLSNAIKYSPPEADIEVTADRDGDGVRVCVRDRGPGIPEDQRDRVFERFYRLGDAADRGHPGLGLGLYIAAEIVRRHGGRIWVEGAAGEGATFCFWLPHQATPNEPIPATMSRP